jgi:hypothetical protein
VTTAISSSKVFGKGSSHLSHIKEELEETKAAGNALRYVGSQPIEGLPGTS